MLSTAPESRESMISRRCASEVTSLRYCRSMEFTRLLLDKIANYCSDISLLLDVCVSYSLFHIPYCWQENINFFLDCTLPPSYLHTAGKMDDKPKMSLQEQMKKQNEDEERRRDEKTNEMRVQLGLPPKMIRHQREAANPLRPLRPTIKQERVITPVLPVSQTPPAPPPASVFQPPQTQVAAFQPPAAIPAPAPAPLPQQPTAMDVDPLTVEQKSKFSTCFAGAMHIANPPWR